MGTDQALSCLFVNVSRIYTTWIILRLPSLLRRSIELSASRHDTLPYSMTTVGSCRMNADVLRALKRWLMRQGGSEQDADDVIQEAYLRMLQYLEKATVENERAFLYCAARNLLIDKVRKDKRGAESVEIEEVQESICDPAPNHDEVLHAQQRLVDIWRRLYAKSPRMCLMFLEQRMGATYEEIARHFQVSVSTVEKEIARAAMAIMDMKDAE